MRSASEIEDRIHKAMIAAMYKEWGELTAAEEKVYRLIMHGIEMAVAEKNTK